MIARPLRLLVGFSTAVALYAQAGVEYALKSSGSAMSGSGGQAAIGSCRVDSTVLSCLSRTYPRAAILVGVVICVFILRALTRRTVR